MTICDFWPYVPLSKQTHCVVELNYPALRVVAPLAAGDLLSCDDPPANNQLIPTKTTHITLLKALTTVVMVFISLNFHQDPKIKTQLYAEWNLFSCVHICFHTFFFLQTHICVFVWIVSFKCIEKRFGQLDGFSAYFQFSFLQKFLWINSMTKIKPSN